MPSLPESRARRVLGIIGAVVGTTVTFVTAAGAGVVLHLDAAPARRLVATQATALLEGLFAGDVAIERIGHLGLRGASGVCVRVKDPTGFQVLFASGVRARVRTIEAARSALSGKGDIVVAVDVAALDHVDVAIDGDEAGNLRLANAFAAKTKTKTETPPAPEGPSSRGVRIEAPEVFLGHAWVHGQAPGAPSLDAEIAGLLAHAHYDGALTKVDLENVDLVTRGLPRGIDPRGRVSGHFSMPSTTGKNIGIEAVFDGVVAKIPTSAQARMDGLRVDAWIEGRDPSGEGVRSTFGEVGIEEDVTLDAEAHGELPRIAAKARVALGRGTVDVDGHVDLHDGTKADADVAVRHVDLHGIVSAAPISDVGLDARVNVTVAESGDLNGDVTLATLHGRVDGVSLPIVEVRGSFTNRTAHATGTVDDPRVVADFEVDMKTVDDAPIASARLHTTVGDFSRFPARGARVKGHATLDAIAKADLGAKTLEGRARIVAGAVSYGPHWLDDATILATASGTFDHPTVDVDVHADGLASGKHRLDVADVRARIEPGAVTVVRDAHVDLVEQGRTLSATALRATLGGSRMSVERAVITGLGEPLRANFTRDANEMHVTLDGPSIDLARVAFLVGDPDAVRSGRLAVSGDVTLRRDGATGRLHGAIDDLATSRVGGARVDGARVGDANMALDASFDGRKVAVAMTAELADAGSFELATKGLVIGGSPIESASWKRAWGRAKFDANLDMVKLATLVPESALPVSEIAGRLVIAGTFRRDRADVPPELSIHADTRNLVVAGKAAPERPLDVVHRKAVSGVQPWRSEGVDLSFDASVDATSGDGEIALHAFDATGTLLGFDAKSKLPYRRIMAEPSAAAALLEGASVRAKLVIPKRELADMPLIVGTRSVSGSLEAELDLTGTVLDPRVDFVAHGRGLRAASLPPALASDVDLTFAYDGARAELVTKVRANERDVLELGSRVDIRARDLVDRAPGAALAWNGSAHVKLAGFPLDTVAAFGDRHVKGRVSGDLVLEDLHQDAKMHAQILLDGVTVGQAAYTGGKVVVDSRDGKLTASARLEQRDGYAEARGNTGLTWGDALTPSLDASADTEGHLEAKAFRAAAIRPFVTTLLNELDGRIDANATVKIGPGFKDPTMEGKVSFHDGTLQFAMLGEELKNARATVTFQPGGVIAVDDVAMEGTGGELTADARLRTRGLGLASASANVHIPKRHAMNFAMQGQPVGRISGDVKLAATNREDVSRMDVVVDVPTLDVALPQRLKSSLQDFSVKPNIRVGVFREPARFVKLPLDEEDLEAKEAEAPETKTIVDVDVHLGEITVTQGNTARIVLAGNPHIRVANPVVVTGQVRVKEGKVDVQGKQFTIEKGTVTFQPGAPDNPIVVATAEWDAEDGTKIYADFVGPVKTGKVTLRSEPARPRNEILAIILFGTADGANASPPPGRAPDGTTTAAVGLGGGFAAQGLTEALDDLTGIQASARIDTTRASNPAPEVEIQLARRIAIAFEHVLGTPPISEPDTNLATIDWRFRNNWSLETTVGDRGLLQTDAVWQKRY